MNELITKVEGLKKHYDQDVLLEVAEEYNKKLKADEIGVTLWYEAIFEAIEALKAEETTIESFLEDTKTIMSNYSKLSDEVVQHQNEGDELKAMNTQSFMTHPIFFLQVVYMWKHEAFNGNMDDFAGDYHNDKFVDALEVGH